MTKVVGPHLVGSQPSAQQVLLAAGIREIPSADIATYKAALVAANPGTRLGNWLHHKMLPTGIFYALAIFVLVMAGAGSFFLLICTFNSQVDTDIATRIAYGLGSMVGWIVTGILTNILADSRGPSYWMRFKWPETKGEHLGFVLVAAEARTRQERIALLAPPGTQFGIDVFYKNGVREDPIGYVIDPIDKSEHAFVVWINNDVIDL